jgi:type II secretory pathway component PulC
MRPPTLVALMAGLVVLGCGVPEAADAPEAEPAVPRLEGPVACERAGRCTIDAETFATLVADPEPLREQVVVVPALDDGRHVGYRLESVAHDGLPAALGFRSGDVLTHVNGYDLTNGMHTAQLLGALKGTRAFAVRLRRDDQPLAWRFDLRQRLTASRGAESRRAHR